MERALEKLEHGWEMHWYLCESKATLEALVRRGLAETKIARSRYGGLTDWYRLAQKSLEKGVR